MNQIMYNFSKDGLIFFCKLNEYNKSKPLKFEEITCIYNTLESNPQFQNLENRICYISCCLYLLTKYDDKYMSIFCQKIISNLRMKQNPINDTYLFLIYNCIDFDENFLHSDKKRISFLLKYLERFSSLEKTKDNYLLYKYYREILNFRLGNIEEALKDSNGIIVTIEEENEKTKYLEFIQLKNELFQIKLNEASKEPEQLKENYCLLKNIYEKVKDENNFLALKLGFSIYNNLYRQNSYNECIPILNQMYQIIKNYERLGANPKKFLRFSLSIFSRFGLIGLLLSNRQLVDFAINELTKGILLIKDDRNNKRIMSILKAYSFAVTLLKLNCNIYIEEIREISNIFNKEFIVDRFNDEGKYLYDGYCVNNLNINQCLINLNALNNNLDMSVSDKAQKLIDYYISQISKPGKNLLSNDVIFTFIVGLHDRIRYISEKFLVDKNEYNKEKYKAQILLNTKCFWNYININADSEPLLKTDFFKSIIIKILSCCVHIYFLNNNFNKVTNSFNHFDELSKKLNINENTPSYELIYKVKGDYYFKKNDFKTAINFYNNSINKMKDLNPKKPVIYFNLGVMYYHLGNKKLAIDYMGKAAEYFKKVNDEKSTFEFHKRNNMLMKKNNLINYIIKQIQNN